MKTVKWRELRGRKLNSAELAEIDRKVKAEVLEMDLRELREALRMTQEDMAAALKKNQSEVSRVERRDDFLLSTLKEYVHALGGELEISAHFGKRRVRLRAL